MQVSLKQHGKWFSFPTVYRIAAVGDTKYSWMLIVLAHRNIQQCKHVTPLGHVLNLGSYFNSINILPLCWMLFYIYTAFILNYYLVT